MKQKQLVAQAIVDATEGQLSLDEVMSKIEVPKTYDLGDYAFPTFILAKLYHKAPQQIAPELVEKISGDAFDKVQAVGPYVNFLLTKKHLAIIS
jgi:Arginyl-tRNA synthetase